MVEAEVEKKVKIVRPQKGFQEQFMVSNADITIGGGAAGVGKTAVLSLEPLYDVSNSEFLAVFFRRKATELGPVLKECHKWYTRVIPTPTFTGKANSSEWKFPSGALVEFAHLQYDKDVENHQGKEYSLICFDELTHFSFFQFNYLLTRNRSTSGVKSRVKATCNPDPDSWVAKLIDWWIGDDGFPIKERWGKIRYFLVNGDDISDYIWGNTPEEVKEKAGDLLKIAVTKADSEFVTEDHFITSLTFIGGKLNENKELLKKDPTYYSKLYNQGEAIRKTLLEGNWKFRTKGEEIVNRDTMDDVFNRPPQTNGRKCISSDIAGEGTDKMVIKCYDGFHLIDIEVIGKSDGKEIIHHLLSMARRHDVPHHNIVYDANGVGSHIKGFIPNAIAYKSQDKPIFDDYTYNKLKDECCLRWANRLNGALEDYAENPNSRLNYSISHHLLGRVFNGKTLEEHYQHERKAIKLDPKSIDGKKKIIKKTEMIPIINGSPDYIETDIMLELLYLNIQNNTIDLIW